MSSPTKPESSSQILSLVEALTSAKKEIDSQGDRVKQLEDLLRQERKARESAEERARRLETHQPNHADGDGTSDKRGMYDDSEEDQQQWKDQSATTDATKATDGSAIATTTEPGQPSQTPEDIHKETVAVDASTSRLQQRLDLMVAEMDEMKTHMERYRRRAEVAEEETTATRKTLAEMVESIRAGDHRGDIRLRNQDDLSPTSSGGADADANVDIDDIDIDTAGKDLATQVAAAIRASGFAAHSSGGGLTDADGTKLLQHAVATALLTVRREPRNGSGSGSGSGSERLAASVAPYASVLGVVLIGVGIMTWLNGWEKGGR